MEILLILKYPHILRLFIFTFKYWIRSGGLHVEKIQFYGKKLDNRFTIRTEICWWQNFRNHRQYWDMTTSTYYLQLMRIFVVRYGKETFAKQKYIIYGWKMTRRCKWFILSGYASLAGRKHFVRTCWTVRSSGGSRISQRPINPRGTLCRKSTHFWLIRQKFYKVVDENIF